MPHDPIRAADTRGWLAKADMDLKAAAHELTAVSPFTADAGFHAQQAAEKARKGFLAWHDAPFRKTHDLAETGQRCAGIDSSLESLLMRAASLTQYAWKFRYPGEPRGPALLQGARRVDEDRGINKAETEACEEAAVTLRFIGP